MIIILKQSELPCHLRVRTAREAHFRLLTANNQRSMPTWHSINDIGQTIDLAMSKCRPTPPPRLLRCLRLMVFHVSPCLVLDTRR
jgi:hypothetical protein